MLPDSKVVQSQTKSKDMILNTDLTLPGRETWSFARKRKNDLSNFRRVDAHSNHDPSISLRRYTVHLYNQLSLKVLYTPRNEEILLKYTKITAYLIGGKY